MRLPCANIKSNRMAFLCGKRDCKIAAGISESPFFDPFILIIPNPFPLISRICPSNRSAPSSVQRERMFESMICIKFYIFAYSVQKSVD